MKESKVVCFLLKGFPRISETFISNEILGLERLGFKIHIISMRHPRENFAHHHIRQIKARVDYLPESIRPHLKRLLTHNLHLLFQKPQRYGRALKKAMTRWMRTRKSASFKHLLQAGYLVDHLLPGSNIAHFHAHFAHSPTSVALFASMLSGTPFSFFAHAKDIYTQDVRQLREKMDRAAFVMTCTRYNRKYLAAIGSKTPVDCVYHGIHLDYFSLPRKTKLPCPPYHILTVARHTEKKGLDLVIRAMALLKQRGIDFSHTIIGEGDDRKLLEQQIASLGLESRVTLSGALDQTQVIDHYKRADLFILGCRIAKNGDRDGIPNVIAESMAMGVPVVAPKTSGIPELLIHEQTGLLVVPEDPEALALAAERLLLDLPLRQRVIKNARKKVEDCFDHNRLIPDLARLYARGMKLPVPPEGSLPPKEKRQMKIAFYAPFKPMDHPTPSGDRTIARGIARFLKERGHDVQVQSQLRTRWIFNTPQAWPRAVKELLTCLVRLKKNRPHLWLTYHTYYKAPDVLGPLVCAFLNIPYVIFGASFATKRRKQVNTFLGFYLNRFALTRATQVFTNSRRDFKRLEQLLPGKRLIYIRPGIDPTPYARQGPGAPTQVLPRTERPIILTAAMFRKDVKTLGLLWLIRCCGQLAAKNIDFELRIAGDGQRRRDLERWAQFHLPGRHRFLGRLAPEEMPNFYARGDLFAFPGINESLGMVFLEAQASGLPILAFDTGGIPGVVVHGKTGYLTPAFDTQAFGAALESLVTDLPRTRRMGQRARAHVCAHHDLAQTYERLNTGLKRMVS